MQVNADFTARTLVRFDATPWVASPAAGVERKMLDRLGGEVARATSIVRFAPGSTFAAHVHDGGEEYLVLEGTFQDESGDFPAGTYVRNPPTTRHSPAARDGATILVKLHQFDPADRHQMQAPLAPGLLFSNHEEEVRVQALGPGESLALDAAGGLEMFVLDGSVTEAGERLGRWDWLRLPTGSRSEALAGPGGAWLWLKSGHLAARPPATPGA